MFKEILKKLEAKRDVTIEATQYGVYTTRKTELLYNDADQKYELEFSKKDRNVAVSSIKSFIDYIKEELDRLDNKTGKKATVIISNQGGLFSADDDFGDNHCRYSRAETSLWKTIKSVANRKLNHEELLTTLQKLRPCIADFQTLYRQLLDIRTIGRSEVISNPVFIDGEAGAGYKINFKLQSGNDEQAVLPSQFSCTVPYAKGRPEVAYEIPVELMFLNDGHGRIEVLFQCAELEQIEEEALQDEVDYLVKNLGEFKDLLVLLNY